MNRQLAPLKNRLHMAIRVVERINEQLRENLPAEVKLLLSQARVRQSNRIRELINE